MIIERPVMIMIEQPDLAVAFDNGFISAEYFIDKIRNIGIVCMESMRTKVENIIFEFYAARQSAVIFLFFDYYNLFTGAA